MRPYGTIIRIMLRQIRGTVLSINDNKVLIEVHGFGIGVLTTKECALSLSVGTESTLSTHLVVRDTGLELFGFPDESSLSFFELLLTVSGVGPRSAINMMNLSPLPPLKRAIRTRDIGYLTKVAGVGKKLAEKVMVELSEKIPDDGIESNTSDTDVLDAMIALGYTERDARTLIKTIPNTLVSKDERLRYVLKEH